MQPEQSFVCFNYLHLLFLFTVLRIHFDGFCGMRCIMQYPSSSCGDGKGHCPKYYPFKSSTGPIGSWWQRKKLWPPEGMGALHPAVVLHRDRTVSPKAWCSAGSMCVCVVGAGGEVGRGEDQKESSCQEDGGGRGPAQAGGGGQETESPAAGLCWSPSSWGR